jgi:hypothetical protein
VIDNVQRLVTRLDQHTIIVSTGGLEGNSEQLGPTLPWHRYTAFDPMLSGIATAPTRGQCPGNGVSAVKSRFISHRDLAGMVFSRSTLYSTTWWKPVHPGAGHPLCRLIGTRRIGFPRSAVRVLVPSRMGETIESRIASHLNRSEITTLCCQRWDNASGFDCTGSGHHCWMAMLSIIPCRRELHLLAIHWSPENLTTCCWPARAAIPMARRHVWTDGVHCRYDRVDANNVFQTG